MISESEKRAAWKGYVTFVVFDDFFFRFGVISLFFEMPQCSDRFRHPLCVDGMPVCFYSLGPMAADQSSNAGNSADHCAAGFVCRNR